MVSLIQALQEKASFFPQKKAFIHLGKDGHEIEAISFEELDYRARSAACFFHRLGLSEKPVVFLMKTRIMLIACFFGCIYAGALPVPMPSPRHGKSWDRFRAVTDSSGAAHILTDRATLSQLSLTSRSNDMEESDYLWLAAEDVLSEGPSSWKTPDIGPDNLAFLQYTSGSTGNPKGVMISHGNLLENAGDISFSFGLSEESVSVSWLPLFHDMGLVAHIIQPVVCGCASVLLDPRSFIMKPSSWLRAITSYKADFSGAPNFAYELCVRRIPENEDAELDLSTWQAAYSGAEPVRRQTLESFYARFKKTGFKRGSFYPVYGLAEATLMASGKQAGETYNFLRMEEVTDNSVDGRLFFQNELISCGAAVGRQCIKIVDPVSGACLDEGNIGEIWINGENVAKGYWCNPEDTARCFIADARDGSVWFRTGDLGFIKNGNLYIAGRIKDILIVNGENYSAEDMEYSVSLCHPGFTVGGCAVFSVETETGEEPAAACEIASDTDVDAMRDMAAAVCKTISTIYGAPLYDVVFTGPGKLPRTTSGKIQRHVVRRQYMRGEPDAAFDRAAHPCLARDRFEAVNEKNKTF